MKKFFSWNNKRHGKTYWISIFILLFVSLNIFGWFSFDEYQPFIVMKNFIYKFYSCTIPSFIGRDIEYILLTLFTFYLFIIIIIWTINHLCGFLPNLKISESGLRYGYLLKTVVIEDIFLGVILEICASKGMLELINRSKITSITSWLYIAAFLFGSYLFWKSTMIFRKIYFLDHDFRYENAYEKNTWYCISNCKERISTFSRAPWKGQIKHFFVDKVDIHLRKEIFENRFLYYLLIIDCNIRYTEEFEKNIYTILSIPHANILALTFGKSNEYRGLEDILKKQKNVKIVHYQDSVRCEHLDIETIVDSVEYKNSKIKRLPCRFLINPIILETYFNIGLGSKICLDFMKTITNDLDILPSIYALFDYVDLQYRIQIAYLLDTDYQSQYKWMSKKWKIIGNINTMSKIVENSVIKSNIENDTKVLSVHDIFNDILSEEDMMLINKYLPNYKKRYNFPIYQTIIHLTSSLRNVLRGHGNFEEKDAMNLYVLVFKLAMLNVYILGTNDISLSVDKTKVWKDSDFYCVSGNKKAVASKRLSPFIIATENENILVFNNWNKGNISEPEQIEYINYLDGTLILPKYRSISV